MIYTQLRIPDDIHEQLRKISYEQKKSINQIVIKYIEEGLINEKK